MVRTLIRTSIVLGALALVPLRASAKEPTNAENAGNQLERKGNKEEKAADADKARADKMEKKGKAKMKAAEARGAAAEEMEKSGNKVEKAGVKEKKEEEKAAK